MQKNGKSGIDFRISMCYNKQEANKCFKKQRKSTLGNYGNSFLMY